MIAHPRTRHAYRRRIESPVVAAVRSLRHAGYRVYRDKGLHRVRFPKAGKDIFLTDLELSALAGMAA